MSDYRQRIQTVLNRCIRSKDYTDGDRFIFKASRDHDKAVEFAFGIPEGYNFMHVKRQIKSLSAACGAIVELEDRKGVVFVKVFLEDFPKQLTFEPKHVKRNGILVGYNRVMEPIYHPLNTHVLMGGASRAGKTDGLRWLLYQLWLQGYEIRICDLKGFSFFPFELLSNITIAKDMFESHDLLAASLDELEQRKRIVIEHRNRDIIQTFKPIVVIIDEAASLAPSQHSGKLKAIAKQCDEYISLFGQQAREPRMFMIYATQRPDMDVINKQFKANVEASIAFRTKDHINSHIILGRSGAEEISPDTPGRCIYSYDRDHVLQVPYIGDDNAWNRLLIQHRTEVIYEGRSERRAAAHGEYTTDCEHVSDSSMPVQTVRISSQASERSTEGTRTREANREPAPGRHVPRLALNPSRPNRDRDTAEVDATDFF